jgi:hypothetical protein
LLEDESKEEEQFLALKIIGEVVNAMEKGRE